ncbi:MAG TPA: AraC family transcriptional regulator [Capsulimonadaceae bacterium]|jgi:AraC-like DNA-binding protein
MQLANQPMHGSPSQVIEFCGGGAYAAARGNDFPRHKHSVWELVYYRSGHIRCTVGDAEYAGVPGLLLVTPPGTLHSETASTAYSNFFVSLRAPADVAWPTAIRDEPALGFSALFASIVRELSGTRPHREHMLTLLAAQLAVMLERAALTEAATPAEAIVARAEALIHERCHDALRIADVAKEVGCSTSSLRAHFAALRQTSPQAYLRDARLANAMAFVHNSTLTLEAIAERCGYDSASHLSRSIKAATGDSPGKLRPNRFSTPQSSSKV